MADKGVLLAIFFMVFTLFLILFLCVVSIVRVLIVDATRGGGVAPVIGKLGFLLALTLPFALFVVFHGRLNMLLKLVDRFNSVKVGSDFLESSCVLKFLSIADIGLGLHLLNAKCILLFGGYILKTCSVFIG